MIMVYYENYYYEFVITIANAGKAEGRWQIDSGSIAEQTRKRDYLG